MVQVPSHVVCFFPLLSDHQETFSLWSGFIIASGFDGAYGQMSPAFCVCVTDEQQCCEPHGSQQHLTGSERIRKTHQLHPRAAEHDVSRSDFYPSTRFTLTVHPAAQELLILQSLNITTELACSAQHKHISGFLFSNTRTRITHPFMRSFWCVFYSHSSSWWSRVQTQPVISDMRVCQMWEILTLFTKPQCLGCVQLSAPSRSQLASDTMFITTVIKNMHTKLRFSEGNTNRPWLAVHHIEILMFCKYHFMLTDLYVTLANGSWWIAPLSLCAGIQVELEVIWGQSSIIPIIQETQKLNFCCNSDHFFPNRAIVVGEATVKFIHAVLPVSLTWGDLYCSRKWQINRNNTLEAEHLIRILNHFPTMYFLSFLENTPWFACVVSFEACSNKNASQCSFIFCFNI